MASIKRAELKNGRVVYRIVIILGQDKNGKRLVKNLTYSVNQSATAKQQEKEALKYAVEIEDKIKYGHDCDVDKMLFDEFADKWLEDIKGVVAYSTYESYKLLVDNKIVPYFKSITQKVIRLLHSIRCSIHYHSSVILEKAKHWH